MAPVVATGPAPLPITGALLDKLLASLREPGAAGVRPPSTVSLSSQRPSLRHFHLRETEPGAAGRAARAAARSHHLRPGQAPTAAAVVPPTTASWLAALTTLALAALTLVLLALRPERAIRDAFHRTISRLQPTRRMSDALRIRRLRPALAAALAVTVLPGIAAGAQLLRTPGPASGAQLVAGTAVWTHPPVAAPSGSGERNPTTSREARPTGAHPAWTQLVSIESQVSADQVQLVVQDQALRKITALAARATRVAEDVQPGDAHPAVVTFHSLVVNRLAEATARKQAAEQHYEQAIQAEYDLFRTAAPVPDVREGLLAAAAEQTSPEIQAAIAFNLSAIQTQMAQEAAISAAEARLQLVSSAAPTQLRALTPHQSLLAPEFGVVTQAFGPTDFGMEGPLTYRGVTSPHFHWGIDIGCALNTPVHAAADGVVVLATASLDAGGAFVGYGNHVVIAHPDGLVTLYAHLNSLKVQAGDVVRQGQVIGLEGSTGWSTGPHLHFEVRRGTDLLDPRPLLGDQLPA